MSLGTNGAERLRIESVGRVSIGLGQDCNNFGTNYNALQIHSSSGVNSYLSLTNSTTGTNGTSAGLNLVQTGVNALVNNRSAGYLAFQTSDTERLRIASNGALGIAGANYGTDGQVLTSTGSGSAPAWEDAGGGGGDFDENASWLFV